MSQLYLAEYEKHRDKGLACLKAGDGRMARQHLLAASLYLLKTVQDAADPGWRARHQEALRLRDLARSIEDRPGRTADAESGRPKEEDDGTTPESKWLISEKPDVRFDQIAGLADVKEAIRLRVIYPLQKPDVARKFRKRSGGGLLLYGPPGTGKTMIARALATEIEARFFNVKCSNIMSQWVGVAERNLAKLFEAARHYPVSLVFLDETEALVGKRGGHSTVMNRVIPEFLAQVDGLEQGDNCLLLVGATNRPWDMDEAALRPGRFGEKFFVGLPDPPAREQILRLNLEGIPMESGVDLAEYAQRLDRFSGADIAGLCLKATDFPFQREIHSGAEATLTRADLEQAIRQTQPSVNQTMLARYRQFADRQE